MAKQLVGCSCAAYRGGTPTKDFHVNKLSYSIDEAVDASGIGRTTIYALIKAGELTPVKIGKRTLIRKSDLEALLERRLAA